MSVQGLSYFSRKNAAEALRMGEEGYCRGPFPFCGRVPDDLLDRVTMSCMELRESLPRLSLECLSLGP
eukprot:6492136-Amphidinium_carterae.1